MKTPAKTLRHHCQHALLLLALCAVWAAPARAENDPFAAMHRAVSAAAASKPGNTTVGVAVVDVVTGHVIYEQNADAPLNPASNAKVITAAVALKVLGPEFRFTTQLHGRSGADAIQGPLYIKGHADPSLTTAHLFALAHQLRTAGIARIEGGITVDDSYFDAENEPFAFDQQPGEDNAFRAPVGAVSLNRNAIEILIRPAPSAMTRAIVTLDPPGYAVLANDTITVGQGAHDPRISALPFENRTRIRVWGQIPQGSRPVRYYRRIDNPSLLTGHALMDILKQLGITTSGTVQLGKVPPGAPLLASHASEPLSALLWETGKMSNNFYSETFFKVLGAETTSGPGTWEAAEAAVANVLEGWGIPKGTYKFKNGSGLFDANEVSAHQFCQVLRAAWRDAAIRPEFLTQLATGGVDGTIKSRYATPETRRYVRAKTGTLNSVITLTGYVLDKTGERPVAFSILLNRAAGYASAARAWQEKIVTAIAHQLNGPGAQP
ncbi:MAG: D-alanyl-D-alanine carboxypeptidase/D-alanyl-D-alanine-endopeptidase [Proteobacteria bacterium]|nr:D-alanyl-D-alanine carboxypeptidase/D-alanyl-D-alanine-endopeptidase [Pseudomonadota bacterium]